MQRLKDLATCLMAAAVLSLPMFLAPSEAAKENKYYQNR